MIGYTVLLIAVMVISASGTRLLRDYAIRLDLLDHPNDRSSHSVSTPRLGGLGIALAALVGWTAAGSAGRTPEVMALISSAVIAGLIGFIDDVRPLSPAAKLVGEILAVVAWITIQPESATTNVLSLGLTAFWLLAFMNFFNFMDGSNGLAGGFAVLAALGLAACAVSLNQLENARLAGVVAASASGFLLFNFPRASMFMGDSGSLFLGITLAILARSIAHSVYAGASISAAVLAPFLFDPVLTLALRVRRSEPVWRAHRSHLYQRLLMSGATHVRVALIYFVWAAFAGISGWTALQLVGPVRYFVAAGAYFPGLLVLLKVWNADRRKLEDRNSQSAIDRA